jgi:uncharacterized membrane protein YbhN (UPF0104 family)
MKNLRFIVKTLLVGIILFFIIRNLYSNLDKLGELDLQLNYPYLIISLIALLLAWIATVWSLQRLFAALSYDIPFSDVYTIYFRSIAGKYIPGKLWQIAGSTYLAAKRGIPEGISVTSFVMGQSYSVLSGLTLAGCMGAFGLLDASKSLMSPLKWTSVLVVALMLIFALRPDLTERLINLVLRLFNRKRIRIELKFAKALEIFLLFGGCWFIFGFAFWLFTNSLVSTKISLYIDLTAIQSAAMVIGFLSLFAPGGLGVREGILVLLLSSFNEFPTPLPSAIALGFRFIVTLSELISIGLTWIIERILKR